MYTDASEDVVTLNFISEHLLFKAAEYEPLPSKFLSDAENDITGSYLVWSLIFTVQPVVVPGVRSPVSLLPRK